MAVRKVLRMGDPLLWRVAEPVTDFHDPALQSLIDDMFDTMETMNGAGLAAPQIGANLRVVIFSIENNPRYSRAESVPATVLINNAFFAERGLFTLKEAHALASQSR